MSSPDAPKRKCFFICPIGDNSSPERERSDLLLDYLLKPVLEPLEFDTILRADQMPHPGMITNQIIEQLLSCDLVIADLAGSNANVFYELAIRHAARKPSIHLFLPEQKIPFDLAGSRAIPVDTLDVRAFETSKKALSEQVAQTFKEGENSVDSPFATALAVISMSTTGSSVEKMLAHVVNTQAEIINAVQALAARESDNWPAQWPKSEPPALRMIHTPIASEIMKNASRQQRRVEMIESIDAILAKLPLYDQNSPEHEEIVAKIESLREMTFRL